MNIDEVLVFLIIICILSYLFYFILVEFIYFLMKYDQKFAEFFFQYKIYQNITGKYKDINKYKNALECLKSYQDIISSNNLKIIPDSILYNKDFLKELINYSQDFYKSIDKEKIGFETLCFYLEKNKNYIRIDEIPIKYRNMKEIIMNLSISSNYSFLPEELQMDDEIIEKALREKGPSYEWFKKEYSNVRIVDDDIRSDRCYGYFNLPITFQNNVYIIRKALELNGNILKFLEHKNNKEFVKIAIFENPKICEFLSHEMKNDKEIALYTININASLIRHFNDSVKDHELLLKVFDKDNDFVKYNNLPFEGNEDIWEKILEKNGYNIKYLAKELRKDKKIIKKTDIHSIFD